MSRGPHLRPEALVAMVFLLGVEARSADSLAASPASRRQASWITEVLAAELPKYVPHSAVETTEASLAPEPAVEKDGVLNLPKMSVRPLMKESPSDYGWLTGKGRMELALKKYPGLRIGNLFGLNNGIALAMLAEEQQWQRLNALADRVRRVSLDDSPETRATIRLLKGAMERPNIDWLNHYRGR